MLCCLRRGRCNRAPQLRAFCRRTPAPLPTPLLACKPTAQAARDIKAKPTVKNDDPDFASLNLAAHNLQRGITSNCLQQGKLLSFMQFAEEYHFNLPAAVQLPSLRPSGRREGIQVQCAQSLFYQRGRPEGD
mmetsp:Transcript_11313/g.30857  ORF Transcript_11313/g.30857 Transcript_11313/m.30857 type:complete len:132 (+) Transcript_11313:232-627(+)